MHDLPEKPVQPERGQEHDWLPLLLLCLGGALQLAHYVSAPPGVQGDAARLGLHTIDFIYRNVWPFYIYHQGAPDPLILYLQAPLFVAFGFTPATLRGITALVGALAVPAIYIAGRELFAEEGARLARRAGLLAAVALALDPFFGLYCRYGIEGALLPIIELLAFACLWRGVRRRRWYDFCLAGLFIGLSQYAYIVARAFPLALAVACTVALVADRRLRARWRGVGLAAGTAAFVAVPQWLLFLRLPYTFVARTQGSDQPFILGMADPARILVTKLVNQFLMLGWKWDNAYNPYSSQRPLLTPVVFLGLVVATATVGRRKAGHLACLVLAGLMFVPDLLIYEGTSPWATRVVPAIPFIVLAAGLGCAILWRWLEAVPRLPVWAPSLVLVGVLLGGVESQWNFAAVGLPRVNASKGLEWQASLVEVAEADYIAAHLDETILIPSSEYERAPLAFLLAEHFPRRAGGVPVPLAPGDGVLVISPLRPERPTTEGIPAGFLPGEWVLLKEGVAYFMPPVAHSVRPAGEPQRLKASNGAGAATVVAATWSGAQPAVEPLHLSFDDGLDLVGYQESPLVAGQPLTVTLYWQPRYEVRADAQIFVQLLDRNDQAVAGIHDWPLHGAYRVRAWQPGETVPLSYRFPVPADLPPGRYRLICGVVDLVRQSRVPLAGGQEFATVVALKVPLPANDAVPVHKADAHLGDLIDLVGYTLTPAVSGLEVTLFWQARDAPQADFNVFVHLVDAEDRIVAQADAQPLDGQYPTSIWGKGERVVDTRIVVAPPGQYRVYVGLYGLDTLTRLPITSGGKPVRQDRLALGMVELP
jgi:4-amino-4-deoxy-L-arabinose transferase-like glycosyltransferase